MKYHEIVPINPANIPVADFTGTPTSGTAPLTVAFNDTSTHTPIAWSWNFSYGGTSEEQNPVHTFENPGTYTVRMTAANAGGADTEVKEGYVTVTAPQTTFYVYADGVSLYHNFEGNGDLYYSNITPGSFYDKIVGKCGDPYYHTCWYGIGKPIDDATGSKNWNKSEDADDYANRADFSLHAGHGWEDGVMFGTANSVNKMYRTDMKFSNAKWVAFVSCLVLNSTYWENWKSVFDGAHMVMGFDTVGWEANNQGELFAQHMTNQDGRSLKNIRDSWKEMLQRTVDRDDTYAAYMWAEPCKEDYLPGWGGYCSAPTRDSNGQYDIQRESFKCRIS